MSNIAVTDFGTPTVVSDRVIAGAPRRTDGGLNQFGESGNNLRRLIADVSINTTTNKDWPDNGLTPTTQWWTPLGITDWTKVLEVRFEDDLLKDGGLVTGQVPAFGVNRATNGNVYLKTYSGAAAGATFQAEAAVAAIATSTSLSGRLIIEMRD